MSEIEAEQQSDVDEAGDRSSLVFFLPLLAGLSALAVAQPLLDIYGRNPSALSASELSTGQIWWFVALVTLVPVLVAWLSTLLVSRISPAAGDRTRQVWIVCFLVLLVGVLTRRVGLGTIASVAVVVLVVAPAFLLLERVALARTFIRYIALLLPASAVLFVFSSPSGQILRQDEAAAIDLQVESDASLMFLVFDELMLTPLLDTSGSINADRFPGFARLAEDSTWFRDAATAHVRSEQAVPAIFTGQQPRLGAQPYSWDHPESVFTLLGGSRPVDAFESFTSMCPASVCNTDVRTVETAVDRTFFDFMNDVVVVYGHLSLPPLGRDQLPSIDSSWAGFGVEVQSVQVAESDARDEDANFDQDAQIDELLNTGGALGQLAQFESMVTRLIEADSEAASVSVYHGLVPHRPYRATVDGRLYNWRGSDDATEAQRRERYQAMVMQIVALDRVLLRSIERLDEAGLWDDMMVVVVSDHGAVFAEGFGPRKQLRDTVGTDTDYVNVPMFIKYPGQVEGEVNDCPAATLDLMPTIMSTLVPGSSFAFDGIDLSNECPEDRERLVGESDGRAFDAVGGVEQILERVAFYDQWFDADGDVGDIVAIGASADVVGTPVSAGEVSDAVDAWTITELGSLFGLEVDPPEGSIVPAQFVGVLTVSESLPSGTEGLIVINGIVGGVIVQLDGVGPGEVAYTAMVDVELLRSGRPALELLIRLPNGQVSTVGEPTIPSG